MLSYIFIVHYHYKADPTHTVKRMISVTATTPAHARYLLDLMFQRYNQEQFRFNRHDLIRVLTSITIQRGQRITHGQKKEGEQI